MISLPKPTCGRPRNVPPYALPDRRQLSDVPRLPRVSRKRTVQPGRAHHSRRVRVRHDVAQADERSPSGSTSQRRSIWRGARFATSSSPITRRTALRCLTILRSRSTGFTKRAKRSAYPSSRRRDTRPTMSSERSRSARLRQDSTSPSSRLTRISSSSCITAFASTTLVKTERGSTRSRYRTNSAYSHRASSTCWRSSGDTSDNVAGVPGVGKKGAVDLITAFGSLDALLDQAGDLTQRKYRDALLDTSRRCAPQPRARHDSMRRPDRRGC